MATLGQKLREEREKRGWTIQQLATQTRINVQYFEAIEKDDKSSLPGGFFYRSFVRQYARLLELPQAAYQPELDRSLADEAAEAAARDTALPDRKLGLTPIPTGIHPEPENARLWITRIVILVVIVGIATGGYVAWERWKTAQIATPSAQQTAAVISAPAQPPPEPAAVPPAAQQTEPQPPVSQPSVPPAQPVSAPITVTLRATGIVWVSATSGERVLFSGILRAGDVKTLASQAAFRLRIGDAGAVDIEWNGKPVPALGPKGQVRSADFTPSEFRVVPPPTNP